MPRLKSEEPTYIKITHDEFVKMWNDDVAIGEIALKFGVSQNYVSQYAKKCRDECPKREAQFSSSISDHKKFVEMWNANIGIKKIAKEFKVSKRLVSVYAHRHREDCPKREYDPKRYKKVNHKEFVELWKANIDISEIALRFGVSKEYVYYYAREHRADCPSRRAQKSYMGKHKEFVELWNANVDIDKMALKFGVTEAYIYKYAYKHRVECPKRKTKTQACKKVRHKRFVELWNANVSVEEIALEFDVSKPYVYQYAHAHGTECVKRKRFGTGKTHTS